MKSKQCSKCRRTKPLSRFHRDSQASDGFRSECKDCRLDDRRQADYRTVLKSTVVQTGTTVGDYVYAAPTVQFPTFP